MTQLIKETQDYALKVKSTVDKDTGVSDQSYVVFNKKYGVEEVVTQILPQALKFIDDLQVALDATTDISSEKIPVYSGKSRAN